MGVVRREASTVNKVAVTATVTAWLGDDRMVGVRVTEQGVERHGRNMIYLYCWAHAVLVDD